MFLGKDQNFRARAEPPRQVTAVGYARSFLIVAACLLAPPPPAPSLPGGYGSVPGSVPGLRLFRSPPLRHPVSSGEGCVVGCGQPAREAGVEAVPDAAAVRPDSRSLAPVVRVLALVGVQDVRGRFRSGGGVRRGCVYDGALPRVPLPLTLGDAAPRCLEAAVRACLVRLSFPPGRDRCRHCSMNRIYGLGF
jgi:hypothetical protein